MWHKCIFPGLLICLGATAQADVVGGRIGVDYWAQDLEAQTKKGAQFIDLDSSFDADDDANYQLSAALEHPIPFLPNILLQHTRSITRGNSGGNNAVFDGVSFSGQVRGDVELTHTDATAYYEILDNWINLDIGITARKFDGGVELLGSQRERAEFTIDETMPMGYAMAQIDLPFTGWHLRAGGNYTKWDGDTVVDVTATVGWEFFAGLGMELGYRYLDMDYSSDSRVLDAQVQGIHGGLFWDF